MNRNARDMTGHHFVENANFPDGRTQSGSSENLKEIAQEFFDEEILWVEVFEPNSPFMPLTWGIWGLVGLFFERRAIKNGGIASSTLWVITANKVGVLTVRPTLRGWRPERKFAEWDKESVKGRVVSQGNLVLEVETPKGRFEVRAVASTPEAKKILEFLTGASWAQNEVNSR